MLASLTARIVSAWFACPVARHHVVGNDEADEVAAAVRVFEDAPGFGGTFRFFDAEIFLQRTQVAHDGIKHFRLIVNAKNGDGFHGRVSPDVES